MHATAFTHATLLDGTEDMRPVPEQTVVVEDDAIAYVGTSDGAPVPEEARVIDLNGAYLMPGLIDLHTHLIGTGDEGSPETSMFGRIDAAKRDEETLRRAMHEAAHAKLMSGVTTVRCAGDPLCGDIWIRDEIAAGRAEGPRLLAAGEGVSVPGGHGAGMFTRVATDPESARAHTRDLIERGADVTKLFITGGVLDATVKGEPGVLRMAPELVAAACDESHKLGAPVMAHVESTEGVRVALENGVDSIEHGAPMTPEIIELYKERGASVTCTLSPALPLAFIAEREKSASEVVIENAKIVAKGIAESARTALDEGIKLGLGTDASCPNVSQYDMWRELAYVCAYVGITPAQALHLATLGNAHIARLGDVTGSIEVGKRADILVCEGNPLDDFAALKAPSYVMADGKLYERPTVERIAAIDAALDPLMDEKPAFA